MPPSIATDAKIAVHTATDLYNHFTELSVNLHLAETEHTWQKIEQSLLHIQSITRGGAAKFPDFVPLLKENASPINNALLSERTKLSGTAGDLLNSIAPRLGEKFEPLVAVFVPTLLLICARTNKVAVKRAEKSLHFIVKHCRPTTIIAYLKEAIKDKGQGLRAVAAGALVLVLEVTEKERLARRVTDVEGCVRSGATDSNSEVRKLAKRLFELYVEIWPERVEGFTKPMTPTIRRYLALPKTGGLIVDIPPPTASAPGRATRELAPSHQPSRYEEAPMTSSHAQSSRSAPAYNFFPDLPKSTSSSSTSTRPAPGFSVNDATYAKRGLFADQIAAARSARLARMPSFNFDDMAKSSSDNPAQTTMKRQPSFEQPRNHGPASSGAPTFRVPRFDVVVQGESGRSRDVNGYESAIRGDINAHTPSFASASGRSGKTALLAAYKQAFASDVDGAKLSSSSGEHRHRDRSEKPSKHGDKRREKTVAVRFEPESEDDDVARVSKKEKGSDHLHRSKSAPQIAVQDDTAKDGRAAEAAGIKASHSDLAQSRQAARREAEWEDDEDERPTTPPERVLLAQTPRTGVKASRVPAQRVVMQSAVKVSAVRVAAPTPSAKVTASRVAIDSGSLESSPGPKARDAPRTPKAQPAPAKVKVVEPGASKESGEQVKEGQEKEVEAEQKAVGATKASKDEGAKPTETKKPATSVSTAQASKPQAKPVSVKSAPAKAGPSASIAAKGRLETRTAAKPSAKPVAASASSSAAATDSKKVITKPATTVSRPAVARKPLTASTAASRAAQKPAVSSTLSARTIKSTAPTKPTARASGSSAAVTRAKPAAFTKPAPTATPSGTAAMKKAEATTLPSVRSRLTAPTASTRNKIVPAAAVKKFQPKSSSSLASKTKPKSSIAASLTAKSKLVGAQSAASVKDKAVRRASAVMAARIEKRRRSSAGGPAPPPAAALSSPVETADPVISAAAVEGKATEIVAEVPSAEDMQTGEVEKIAEQKKPEEQDEVARTLNQEEETNEAEAAEVVQAEGPIMNIDAASATNDEIQVSEAQEETADSTDQVTPSHDMVEEGEEQELGHESTIAADEIPIEVATQAKAPVICDTTTPSRVRTPLSAKDPNLPKASPISSMTPEKVSSPLLPSHKTRSPFASSPLRRAATPKASLLSQLEAESSFDESESESDLDDESDEVVQLRFGARQTVSKSPMVKNHQVVAAARKQLVLGLGSSSDASLVEANASDETVLLESSA